MKRLNCAKMMLVLVGSIIVALLTQPALGSDSEGVRPIEDAGLSRYAAQDPVVLDGTGSYDPDSSGPLSYMWQQIAGPSVVITDADTARPMISGFIQTNEIQECEFELVVSDGELTSLPDTVKVIIVPYFSNKRLPELTSESFDPDKPTVIVFRGGGCRYGQVVGAGDDAFRQLGWIDRANVIEFRIGYEPDSFPAPTYYGCGDMIIVYLSSVAPNYNKPIQTIGASSGGMPAIDVGLHLNLTYQDPRYAVNRVTFCDIGCRGESDYRRLIDQFVASSVDGEQCWVDSYDNERLWPNALNLYCPFLHHYDVRPWYTTSLISANTSQFNLGVVAGAYWSVIGPGKNLQLASTPGELTYVFQWHGSAYSGYMDFYNEPSYPGRLPEPVTLLRPVDVGDPNGAVLTCEESENAVGYQLLFGSNPYRVMDYNIISDTSIPPNEVITTLPFEETWWTVRVRDQYGSTIYADPICIGISNLSFPVANLITGKKYSYLQDAVNDAAPGDEIVVKKGIYRENINFQGKNLTVRSTDPNDPTVVAATVINGGHRSSVITMSGSQDGGCILSGLTITGGEVGISWYDGFNLYDLHWRLYSDNCFTVLK